MHAQDGCLRRVQDRCGNQRTEDTAVGNCEGTAGHVFNGQFAFFRLGAVLDDLLLDVGQTHGVGITQNRNHQAAIGGNRHADVLVTVIHHVVTIDGRVHRREALQGFGGSLGEERHEAKLDTVTLHKAVLVLLAHLHDRPHVHLVKGGQHGCALLGINQSLGDARTQAGHRYALLGTFALADVDFRHTSRRLGCGSTAGGLGAVYVVLNVFLGYAAIFTGTLDAVRIDVIFLSQLSGRRAQDGFAGRCLTLGFFLRSLFLLVLGRLGFALGAFLELADYLTTFNGIAFVLDDFLNHAVSRRNNLKNNLVGLDIDNQLVTGAGFTRLFVPGRDSTFRDRLRENGGFNLS